MQEAPQSIYIQDNESIEDALIAINSQPKLKIAIVLDANKKLLGTVTDGDIRRGLLSKESLENSVINIMNKTPVTVSIDTPRHIVDKQMKLYGIEVIIITDNDSVIGLFTAKDTSSISLHDNPILIMAGGFGTRLKPLTDNCPKPMLHVGNKPILEWQIDMFSDQGFNNFFISTHYSPEKIENFFGDGSNKGINITYIHEEVPLGTGGALGLLPKNIAKKPLIVINGDILTKIDFTKVLDFHNKQELDATMCVREYEYQVPFGVIDGDGYDISGMTEKPINRFFINAGVYVINNSIIDKVEHNTHINLPTLLMQQINKGKKIMKFPIYEYWLDIGRMGDFERAQADYSNPEF